MTNRHELTKAYHKGKPVTVCPDCIAPGRFMHYVDGTWTNYDPLSENYENYEFKQCPECRDAAHAEYVKKMLNGIPVESLPANVRKVFGI